LLGIITYSISGNLSKLDNAVVQYAGAQGDEIAVGEGDETEGDETEGDETEGDETEGDETEGDETEGDETEGDENRTKVVETAQARIVNVLTIDSVNPEAPIAGVDKVRVEGRTSTTLGFIEVIWGDQEVQKRVEISSGSGYGVWSAEHMYGDSSVGNRQIVVKWWSEDPYGNSVNDVKSYTVNVGSPSVLYPTNLEIDPILDASLDGPTKVGGSLIDDETGEGIENVEITFDGSGADGLSSVTTNEDGKFSAEGTAPDTVGTGWEVQAHFAGESEYDAADSVPASYGTQPAPTNDPDRPTPGTTDVNPGPEFASPDNPIPPEQPQTWPTELLLIVGLTVAAVVIAIAVKLQKGKSGKDNLEVVDEVITRGGTEK